MFQLKCSRFSCVAIAGHLDRALPIGTKERIGRWYSTGSPLVLVVEDRVDGIGGPRRFLIMEARGCYGEEILLPGCRPLHA